MMKCKRKFIDWENQQHITETPKVSLFLHPKIRAYKYIMNICLWAERLVNYFWCLHKENVAGRSPLTLSITKNTLYRDGYRVTFLYGMKIKSQSVLCHWFKRNLGNQYLCPGWWPRLLLALTLSAGPNVPFQDFLDFWCDSLNSYNFNSIQMTFLLNMTLSPHFSLRKLACYFSFTACCAEQPFLTRRRKTLLYVLLFAHYPTAITSKKNRIRLFYFG